LLVIQVSNI